MFRPKAKQPDFTRLKGTIAQLKTGDESLSQTLHNIIDWLAQFQGITISDIADLNNSINNANTTINNISAGGDGYPAQLGHAGL